MAIGSASCLDESPFKLEYQGFAPRALDDGWNISTPEAEGMDPALLESAYRIIHEDDRYRMLRSLLVLRNGRIVAEAYPRDPDDIHGIENIQSATKSITSLLTGIAFEGELFDSLDQPISTVFPERFAAHSEKAGITFHQALSMTAGIGFNNSDHTGAMVLSDHSVDFVLDLPMAYQPGTSYNYNDGVPQLISYAIERRSGRSLAEYAREHLFEPLGILDWSWEGGKEGTTFGAFSLYLKPRDMAKIGQMLLQNGVWDGRQVVPADWIQLATQMHYEYRPYWVYGYYFWLSPFEGPDFFTASGHGGQRITVVPELKLVVVSTAWPYSKDEMPYVEDFHELFMMIIDSCH
jgi:CubicO group peptidase (beta-lactamase class C family)